MLLKLGWDVRQASEPLLLVISIRPSAMACVFPGKQGSLERSVSLILCLWELGKARWEMFGP